MPRMTSQRSALLALVSARAARGLTTTAADATRALWSGRGHSATYGVVSRACAAGLLKAERAGSKHLLTVV